MATLNRSRLQRMARTRLDDARILLKQRRYAAAFYMAGYIVEYGLKACIAKQTRRFDFPEKRDRKEDVFTHKLSQLLKLAGLPVDADFKSDANLELNWMMVQDWTEDTRYDPMWLASSSAIKKRAEELVKAIEDPAHGVFQWLQKHW